MIFGIGSIHHGEKGHRVKTTIRKVVGHFCKDRGQ